MSAWGYIGVPADREPGHEEVVFQTEDGAMMFAKGAARTSGKPYRIYKVVETHYIKPIEPEVRRVVVE